MQGLKQRLLDESLFLVRFAGLADYTTAAKTVARAPIRGEAQLSVGATPNRLGIASSGSVSSAREWPPDLRVSGPESLASFMSRSTGGLALLDLSAAVRRSFFAGLLLREMRRREMHERVGPPTPAPRVLARPPERTAGKRGGGIAPDRAVRSRTPGGIWLGKPDLLSLLACDRGGDRAVAADCSTGDWRPGKVLELLPVGFMDGMTIQAHRKKLADQVKQAQGIGGTKCCSISTCEQRLSVIRSARSPTVLNGRQSDRRLGPNLIEVLFVAGCLNRCSRKDPSVGAAGRTPPR